MTDSEEEQFPEDEDPEEDNFEEEDNNNNDGEVIVSDDDDSDIDLPDDLTLNDVEKVEAPKPDKEMEEMVARFQPTTAASHRLLHDLREMMHADTKELGFRTFPKGNDIFRWEVQVFGFDKGTDIYNDLEKYKKQTGRDYIEMSVTFPPTYPTNPPFVRVVQPRFMQQTGRVTAGGSLCTDVLTMDGWSPTYAIESLMINVISEIINGKPRINFSYTQPYTLEEAKAAYTRVASDHNWKINTWLPDK